MADVGGRKTVAAAFRRDASRDLGFQHHAHAAIADMVRGGDGEWRAMADDRLCASKMLIGAEYRSEPARESTELGYRIEKARADGRFEIAGVPRAVVEAFSTRRAGIEAARAKHGLAGAERLGEHERHAGRRTAAFRALAPRAGREAPPAGRAPGLARRSRYEDAMLAGERLVAEFGLGERRLGRGPPLARTGRGVDRALRGRRHLGLARELLRVPTPGRGAARELRGAHWATGFPAATARAADRVVVPWRT